MKSYANLLTAINSKMIQMDLNVEEAAKAMTIETTSTAPMTNRPSKRRVTIVESVRTAGT